MVILLGSAGMTLTNIFYLFPNAMSSHNTQIAQNIESKILLARSGQHPAILLAGGSNVLMGLRAETMSALLRRPVYNLGLVNEGGDYRNVLTLLEASAEPGDMVLISSRGFFGNPVTSTNPIAVRVQDRNFLFEADYKGLSLSDKSILRMLISPVQQPLGYYERRGTPNGNGDLNVCLTDRPVQAPLVPVAVDTGGFVQSHADFFKRMKERGVIVYFLTPDMLIQSKDATSWWDRHLDLRAKFGHFGGQWIPTDLEQTLSSSPEEFCDSALHPNAQRALLKSQTVAKELAH